MAAAPEVASDAHLDETVGVKLWYSSSLHVSVRRNYTIWCRTVDGLRIPFVLETKVLPVAKTTLGFKDTPVPTEKIIIDNVAVNPKLDEWRFAKLEVQTASKGK